MARLIAKYRPPVPILACSSNQAVLKQLNITRGVVGLKIPEYQGSDNIMLLTIKAAKEQGLCQSGNQIVALTGQAEENPDESDVMKIINIE